MSNYEERVLRLARGSVLVECGPMRLVVSAWIGKVPQPAEIMALAPRAIGFLQEVASMRRVLSVSWQLVDRLGLKGIPLEMVESVALVGDEDLTPMACVAGTIADNVADSLMARGMTKVIVDNGGDLALRMLDPEEKVRVGVRGRVDRIEVEEVLVLGGKRRSWGVATSGLGGRSLTRGIAWAATAVAERGSVADAAATAIANSTYVEWDGVERRKAREVDPGSDLGELDVTVAVGELPAEIASLGLKRGLEKAKILMDRGVILGASVRVGPLSGSVGMEGIIEK